MRVERKQYSAEFNREAVRLVTDKGLSQGRKPRVTWVSMRTCWGVGRSNWKATGSEPFLAKANPVMKNWRGCAARLRCCVRNVTS